MSCTQNTTVLRFHLKKFGQTAYDAFHGTRARAIASGGMEA